ncbi:hypothetical protein FOZ63_016735 [Perkinsus olseni]|uniref:Prokaryotic-type class I peptide chain release factors domain-containing protein n=1 Tax=Perkinsus olseni TaxID=32597 RepID=A0A7J6SJ53_PEROL|nr:hypothetical protein FOZ62_016424 [Perkinsus olseni]KAF4733039.1 hypothetical protein FOZ63_016735 [Perkinsus olseni]
MFINAPSTLAQRLVVLQRRFKVTIREKDLEKHFTRSPGPGGQNVNASHTRCQLILDFAKCRSWLSEPVVANLKKLEARTGTLTRSGNAIMITCHETRSQISNYDRALRTLQQKLDAAEAYKEEEKLEFSDWLKTVKSEDEIQEYHEYNRKRRDRDKQHRKMKKELKF